MKFNLPSKVKKVVNFSKVDGDNKAVSITYSGEKLLRVFTKIANDDDFWREAVSTGMSLKKDGPPLEEINAKLFGFRSVPEVIINKDGENLFDFIKEVKSAQANSNNMLRRLGLSDDVVLPAATGEGFKNLYIAGVRYVRMSDEKNGVRPFNWSKGYSLSLIGEFYGAVVAVSDGEVVKAVTDNNEDLLFDKKWDRTIRFARLSDDKAKTVFEIKLKAPSNKAKYLKEISGIIKYKTSSSADTLDLGYVKCKEGARFSKLEAIIKTIKPSEYPKGATDITIKMFISADTIKSIKLFDGEGIELQFRENSYSYSDRSITKTFQIAEKLPKKIKIIIERHSKLKIFECPFELKNIDLLGRVRESKN